jgi:hypothetical protein
MTEHVRGPDSAKPGLEDEHTRIADKRRFSGDPEVEDPDRLSLNRRDVPDSPENSIEARTEDG